MKYRLGKVVIQDSIMRDKYIGDSYDLVKRFWSEKLDEIARLYAHPKFIPPQIHSQYKAVTSIPILGASPKSPFGILLDPDTGIPLPRSHQQPTNIKFATLPYIIEVMEQFRPKYLICFDQSYHRNAALSKEKQRRAKMEFLSERGFASFYYDSHASFLFVTKTTGSLAAIRDHLISCGIPKKRLEAQVENRSGHS